ncbi:hypothetical protein G9A89_016828 [Geosiphon pyriformis]|nr:hypothetical protein G9A89_016828 [Geosiphon pyriformis]
MMTKSKSITWLIKALFAIFFFEFTIFIIYEDFLLNKLPPFAKSFLEVDPIKHIHVINPPNSHKAKQIARSNLSQDGIKYEYLISDLKRDYIDEYAWWAMRSYCLDQDDLVAPGIYAAVTVRDYKLILMVRGESRVDNQEYWSTRNNQLIDYPTTNRAAIGAKVDRVFYENFQRTNGQITQFILLALNEHNINLIVAVGHGSGGAYAVLQMLEMIHLDLNIPLKVYTFGQPHLGNREFGQQFDALNSGDKVSLVRVTNMDDYVPKLPLSTGQIFYVQSNTEIWIESDDCGCPTGKTFLCIGPIIYQPNQPKISLESQECNAQFTNPDFLPNNGPYFGYMMGNCFNDAPPWISPPVQKTLDVPWWKELWLRFFNL